MRLATTGIFVAALFVCRWCAASDPPEVGEASPLQDVVITDRPAAQQPAELPSPPLPNSPESKENGVPEGDKKDEKKEESKEEKKDEGKEEKKEEEKPALPDWFNVFGQATIITQGHGPFHAAYTGPNSLSPFAEVDTSETATLFLGMRVLPGTDVYFDPEIAGGIGFSNVTGVAGFTNGEIPRVSLPQPTPYIARLYARHTFGLGGEQETVESAANELGGKKDISRLTVTYGKFSAEDWFDENRYSHDPRTQFENWSIMYNGAWDYPADVRGYTWGGVVELNQERYAIRYGIFAEPKIANGPVLDQNFEQAYGQAWELELRHKLGDRPGATRWMFYTNKADMGNYAEALALSPVDPDVTQTRTYASRKYGFCMNFEQELSDDLGVFGRLGWNNGQTESWAFTAIDQTIALGLSLKGNRWRRPDDTVGLAMVANGISSVHREYLAAGGLDFIIGDGALNYAPECILESYYNWQLTKKVAISPDFQFIDNPAYNRDRGPVTVWGLRVHAEF